MYYKIFAYLTIYDTLRYMIHLFEKSIHVTIRILTIMSLEALIVNASLLLLHRPFLIAGALWTVRPI